MVLRYSPPKKKVTQRRKWRRRVELNVILWNATAILNDKKADDSKQKMENSCVVQCAALVFIKKSEREKFEWNGRFIVASTYNKDFNSSLLSGYTPSEMAY